MTRAILLLVAALLLTGCWESEPPRPPTPSSREPRVEMIVDLTGSTGIAYSRMLGHAQLTAQNLRPGIEASVLALVGSSSRLETLLSYQVSSNDDSRPETSHTARFQAWKSQADRIFARECPGLFQRVAKNTTACVDGRSCIDLAVLGRIAEFEHNRPSTERLSIVVFTDGMEDCTFSGTHAADRFNLKDYATPEAALTALQQRVPGANALARELASRTRVFFVLNDDNVSNSPTSRSTAFLREFWRRRMRLASAVLDFDLLTGAPAPNRLAWREK